MNVQRKKLYEFGWSNFFEHHFQTYDEQNFEPGRIIAEQKEQYTVQASRGELLAKISGKLRHQARDRTDFPAVGDWVVLRVLADQNSAIIHAVLPRRTKFTRKTAGLRVEEQIIGANIDTVFVMMSLNQDFNLRRLERYLTVSWNSGAKPVVILSKSDLCQDVDSRVSETKSIAPGVPVHAISVKNAIGMDPLSQYFTIGHTVAVVGSSGIGKSTLINYFVGYELLPVQAIRQDDDRGRHTTTHRQLVRLPSGGLILDTPGMRELQLWNVDDGIDIAFDEIVELQDQCRYSNCNHNVEPGCAVQTALEKGMLDANRFGNFQKMQKELRYLSRKQNVLYRNQERQKWKKLSRIAKERGKSKRA